jgi:hypothetical protein
MTLLLRRDADAFAQVTGRGGAGTGTDGRRTISSRYRAGSGVLLWPGASPAVVSQ